MSAPGQRAIIWANGEDVFNIQKLGLILDLEAKCNAGFAVVMARLESGAWGINDLRETIRLGLIGGGMDPKDALAAVQRHIDLNPNGLAPAVLVAYEVLKTAMFGQPKDDPVGQVADQGGGADQGKAKPAEAPETGFTTTTDASDAPK